MLAITLASAAAVALALVVAALSAGPAPADLGETTQFQAESMSYGSFAAVVSDGSAHGEKALRYARSGKAARSVKLPARGVRVVVRARALNAAGSGVGLRLRVDGEAVGEKTISSSSYAPHAFKTSLPKGDHTVRVTAHGLTGNEKALVDVVRIKHPAPPPDADADGVTDDQDNCVAVPNPGQKNGDGDALGDACDGDRDNDGRPNADDYAPDDAGVQDPPGAPTAWSCAGEQVRPGDDLDARVQGAPQGTTFCIHAGTYSLSRTVDVRGYKLIGQPGGVKQRGPAVDPDPVVKIDDGSANLERLFTLFGSGNRLEWLDISGATGSYTNQTQNQCVNWGEASNRCPKVGTGYGVASGQADASTVFYRVEVHHNEVLGIGSMNGRLIESDLHHNGSNADFWGYEAGAVKAVDESEVRNSFVHDNPANGLWCDAGCDNVASMNNGYWVHDNLVVNNGRWGIRYEHAPKGLPDDQVQAAVTALIEGNQVHDNGGSTRGGVSVHDAQNGTVKNNVFGPATVAGVSYPGNREGEAIEFGWERTRADRTDLWNGRAEGNDLNGEHVNGCGMQDTDSAPGGTIVYCSNND